MFPDSLEVVTNLILKASKDIHACVLSCFSHVQLFVIPWTVACQAPLSMGFSRQEWVGISSSRNLPNQRTELASLMSHALAGRFKDIRRIEKYIDKKVSVYQWTRT